MKRSKLPAAFQPKKRLKTLNSSSVIDQGLLALKPFIYFCTKFQLLISELNETPLDDSAVGMSDTMAAILYLKSLFPVEKLEHRVPAVVFVHQLYSVVKNRTQVDKELVRILIVSILLLLL